MSDAWILSSVRTAVGKAPRGTLHRTRTDDLAASVLQGALAAVDGLEAGDVDDVLMGCAFPEAEQGMNLGRIAVHRAGWPDRVPGATVNRFCSSGLQTIAMAAAAIRSGEASVVAAGGAESMSLVEMGGNDFVPNPHLVAERPEVYIGMGLTGENVAARHDVSRGDQDAFALRSHERAVRAIDTGRFDDEIVPVEVVHTGWEDGEVVRRTETFREDEGPRRDTSLEALAGLPPVFQEEGTITAGTSSQTSDGAAAAIVADTATVERLGVTPLARMLGFAVAGLDPATMGMGPVGAVRKLLERTDVDLEDVGLVELNEAFAAQAIAVIRELGLDEARVNVNGGAIALGHPLGCTGAKLTATLLHEMRRRGVRYGITTMCVGGGMGAAGLFEDPEAS